MKRKAILGFLAILLVGTIFISGCIESEAPSSKLKTTTMQPSELILDLSDINYSMKERTPRLKSDVSEEAVNLGWRNGYLVRYIRVGETLLDATGIDQSISLYPIENISMVLELPQESIEGVTFEDIPCSNIGDNCKSWRITGVDEFGYQKRDYTIEFIKMDVYELIYMYGTSTDYELLINLAKEAEAKIK